MTKTQGLLKTSSKVLSSISNLCNTFKSHLHLVNINLHKSPEQITGNLVSTALLSQHLIVGLIQVPKHKE